MEFLVVSNSKLKIMMSFQDMKRFEIDGENVDYSNPKVRRSFWRILDEARERCGFESSGDKILIQFYPSKDGCEIFVTKLGLISSGAERTIARSSKVAMLTTKTSIYKFTEFSSLLCAARIANGRECESLPRAYYDDAGSYYLVSEERCALSEKSEASPLMEYGRELPQNLSLYISEHFSEMDFNSLLDL